MRAKLGFLGIEDLVNNQGELAIALEYDSKTKEMCIEACAQLPADTTRKDLAATYLSLCHEDTPVFNSFFSSNHSGHSHIHPDTPPITAHIYTLGARTPLAIFARKKYKPVAPKVRPIKTELPSRFQIIREIKGDPLQDMPRLHIMVQVIDKPLVKTHVYMGRTAW